MSNVNPPVPPMSGSGDWKQQIVQESVPPNMIQLSDEEKAFLKQMDRKSTISRALPSAVLLSGAVIFAGHRGLIQSRYKLKAGLAFAFGYFGGKISAFKETEGEYLKRFPYTDLANQIRKHNGMAPVEGFEPDTQQTEFDTHHASPPVQEAAPAMNEPVKDDGVMSYDKLREQHRMMRNQQQWQPKGGFMQPNTQQPSFLAPMEQQQPEQVPKVPQNDEYAYKPPTRRSQSTNKYGDEGFE